MATGNAFISTIRSKKKPRENAGLAQNVTGELMAQDMKKDGDI